MTTHLLDTTFLIDYLRGDEGVKEYLTETEDDPLLTTTLNLKEVATGWRLRGEFAPESLFSTFDWVDVVPFRIEHAVAASEYAASLYESSEHTRREIDAAAADLLIAAVADEEGATVVTRNVEDFERFGVPTATY
ncbi:putative nucleic acid-binding protein [Halorubrum alkaliphilum]|uniref:Ribonuclease VapC n=1 Tax=Halorubrum alkaliphilum TaxID=261290 RepID=A0A8T4GEQ9_9EURY|nr:PIN domain-containing protein [Halorubrum alkaliphilum]MBP1922636.1 putative nucleic acid-binding protein [Halorubrum alkaliphilum]